MRALRLDLHLALVHHLGLLPRGQWTPEVDSPQDVDDCIARISRAFSSTEEDLARCLPGPKRAYVFGGLATAAATFSVWLLPDIRVSRTGGCVYRAGLSRLSSCVCV